MASSNSREVNLLDYLLVLVKWRKLLLINFFVVGIAAVIFSLILPKYYRATITFLPPAQSSGLTALVQNLSVDVLGASDITGEACITILNSRKLRQEIIEKYDLMTLYDKDYIEHALKKLESNVDIEFEYQVGIGVSTINSISLSVIDKSPQRAANMANDFLRLLEERIIELNTKKAKNNRIFLGNRLQQIRHDLQAAEDSLRWFQETFGAVEISAQSRVAIETAAQLKAEILATEVERSILEKNARPSNVNLIKINNRLAAMQKEYNQLYDGTTGVNNAPEVLIPIKKIPALALNYYRALRQTEIQNKLYQMIVPMYEQAKIQETKTIPVLKVIDRAVPPTYKYRPKRLFIVIGIVAVSTLFCLLYIFYREYLARLRENDIEQYRKVMALSKVFSFRKNDKVIQE